MNILKIKLHPALILSSVLFWAIVVVLIYASLMYYWINKYFFVEDKNVRVDDAGATIMLHRAARTIYRKKLSQYKIF